MVPASSKHYALAHARTLSPTAALVSLVFLVVE